MYLGSNSGSSNQGGRPTGGNSGGGYDTDTENIGGWNTPTQKPTKVSTSRPVSNTNTFNAQEGSDSWNQQNNANQGIA